ncbi:Transmembrane protein 184C [Nymphon striatum]|nr:Transmembrane protein 184C [Nymphon striatum]
MFIFQWLALTFPHIAIYLDTARACYEAYVIYNFMMFLLSFLHLEMDLHRILEDKSAVRPVFPLCCLSSREINWNFIEGCKHGILQYTIIKPVTTMISFACEMAGVYGEGSFQPDVAFPYIAVVDNISQFVSYLIVAMFSLFMFYRAFQEELKPMRPLPKFLCIKSVVFFSFFQSFIISILVSAGVITSSFTTESKSGSDLGKSLQDFLICFEMFIAALAHKFAFSYHPYVNLAARQVPCCESFLAMWDLSDVHQDVSNHINYVGGKVKQSFTRGGTKSNSTSSPIAPQVEREGLLDNSVENCGSYHSISTRLSVEDVPIKTALLNKDRSTSVNASIEDAHDVVNDLVDLTNDLANLKNT